jgi:lipopolysaccharide export system permease protein
MFGSQIHRYITREVLFPSLLCLVIFTLVMVMGRAVTLVDLIINKGVSPLDILVLLATLLPTFFSIALPFSFLMGIMIGFGRMSADSETVALKSAGIGLASMSVPVFVLAFIFALLTGAANLWINPWGYSAFAAKSFEITRQKATIGFQPRVFMNQFNDLVLYANEIDNRSEQLHGLFIVEQSMGATSWIFAESGQILADEDAKTVTIHLQDGVIHRQQAESTDNYQLIHFRNYDIQPEIAAMNTMASRSMKPKELPTDKLWESVENATDPQKKQGLLAELHARLTSPLAPLLFVLLGIPFSMQSHRSGRSGGFIMGLVIFLGYYFMASAAFTVVKDASASPWLAFWLPQLLLVCAGVFLLRQSSLEKPNLLGTWIDQTLLYLQKRARKHVDS